MPGYIHSTYDATLNALKGCCSDETSITTLNKWEMMPFFCSEKGHGIFQSSLENHCDMIQVQTCTTMYRSSYINYLAARITTSNNIPTTSRYYPTSSAQLFDPTHKYRSVTTGPPLSLSWSSFGMAHPRISVYDSIRIMSHGRQTWLSTGDSMVTRWTTRPPWFKSWPLNLFFSTFSWSDSRDWTTIPTGSLSSSSPISHIPSSWRSRGTQSYQSPTTAPSGSSYPSTDLNDLSVIPENHLLAQFMAYYTYHSSSLRNILNSVIKCPDSTLMPGFVSEFTKSTSMCNNYFGIEFENSVLVTMFQALGFPFHNEKDPFLTQMYGSFARLSVYQNCHTFVYYIYESFKEGIDKGSISLPDNCDHLANSSIPVQKSKSPLGGMSNKQFRIVLIACNVVAAVFLLFLLIICILRMKENRNRRKSQQKYKIPLESISVKVPPLPPYQAKDNVYKDFTLSLPDYETTLPKLRPPYHEGNPFPPRYSFSSLSFKSEDPIVDAWDDPKKLSEKNKEIVQEWVEANEKMVMSRRESMFCVSSESKKT